MGCQDVGPVNVVDLGINKEEAAGAAVKERVNSNGSSATRSSEGQGASFRLNLKHRLTPPDLGEDEEERAAGDDDDERSAAAKVRREDEEAGGPAEPLRDSARTAQPPSPAIGAEAAGAATRSPRGEREGGGGNSLVSPRSGASRSSPIMGPLAGSPPSDVRARELLLPPPPPIPAALPEFTRPPSLSEMAKMDEVAGMASLGAHQWPSADGVSPSRGSGDKGPLPGSPMHIELTIPPEMCSKRMSDILEGDHDLAQEGGFYDPPPRLVPAQAPADLPPPSEGGFYDPPPPKK